MFVISRRDGRPVKYFGPHVHSPLSLVEESNTSIMTIMIQSGHSMHRSELRERILYDVVVSMKVMFNDLETGQL